MIQRIQTLFLGLVVLVMSLNLFSTVWQANTAAKSILLTPFYLSEKTIDGEHYHGVIYIAIIMLLVIGISIFSITQFKKRSLQLKLGLGNSVLLCSIVLCFYLVIGKGKSMIDANATAEFEPGFYLPLIAIVLNILANRYIKKDEDLVKSVDRLR
ncbi:MAG TPA: DUF4293 domain-containing protein [Cytophagaceae bacterium]|jgi:hypothetical protein|nr:DUF4293 domain-containing protein [Cytophagaceae bacterium]